MKQSLCMLCLALLAAGGSVGCSSIHLKDPTAQIVSVKIVAQTNEGARVDVKVELTNPNTIPLPLPKANYTVKVAGGGSYSAMNRPDCTLPASGKQEVLIPAVFATKTALAGANYHVDGSITYEPPGEIRKLLTESHVPLPSASFSGSGKLE